MFYSHLCMMQRVVIIGTPGAGKTTFGKVLAAKLEASYLLNSMHFIGTLIGHLHPTLKLRSKRL